MNRVRMLLGLLALFILSQNDCSAEDVCTQIFYQEYNCGNGTWGYSKVSSFGSYPVMEITIPSMVATNSTVCTYRIYYLYNSGSGWTAGTIKNVSGGIQSSFPASFPTLSAAPIEIPYSDGTSPVFTNYLAGCPTCSVADDDSDGICNSCDTKPGEADTKHCIWQQLVVDDTNQVAIMEIDQSGNCNGSSTVEYRNSPVNDQILAGSLSAHWYGNRSLIDPPTCQGDDGTGNCACGYPTDANSMFAGFEPSDTPQMSDGLREQLQKAEQAANDDNYDDCSNIKARCEAACSTRGGVVKNSCSVSDGTTYANCACQNEFAYDVATPTETPTDTSTGGDVAETGGTDTNADGKADVYAAVKDAIKDSGLTSKVDSTNTHLNSIGNKIDTVGSAINSVSSAVNGVTDGINGLGSGINGVGNGINGLGTKLDTIADKLDNLNDNDNPDITATGSADLPGNNTYNASVEGVDQISLADTIGAFITNGLPIVSYFKGSHIEIGSAIPTLSTHIFGKTITIDFSGMESILNDMGLVLVSVSTILSFMIIIRG